LLDEVNPVNADTKEVMGQIPVPLVPVERAARIVLDGVARKKAVIAFPAYVSVLAFLHRFLPGLFARVCKKQVDDFRKIRRATATT
jgi:hypothetical protein